MTRRKQHSRPQSKATTYLLESLKRKQGIRNLARRYLIVCEDTASAPRYFEALKKYKELSATSVEVHDSDGNTQPVQVVQTAIDIMARAKARGSSTLPFDRAWCVIDGDYGPKIRPARTLATKHGIELAVSTQCFEVWIWFHYDDRNIPCRCCDDVVSLLKKNHIPQYTKGGCDYSSLVRNMQIATERARRCRESGIKRGEKRPEDQNPCSDVYRLIDDLGLPD